MSEGTPPPPPPSENPQGSSPPPPTPDGGYGAAPPQPPPGGSAAPPPAGGYQAAPPPPPPAPAGPRPGELLDRFLARLIDGVLVGVVAAIIDSVIIAAMFTTSDGSAFGYYGGGFSGYAVVVAIVNTVINLGYFAFMESSQGKTVGKMVMKLHVEGPGGAKPTLEQAAKRNIWLAYPIFGVVPFLGIIGSLAALVAVILIAVQINSDPERKPWTDKFAGTQVIKEG